MVQLHPGPPSRLGQTVRASFGGVAQLGERLPCTQEVIGSIPFTSTSRSANQDYESGIKSELFGFYDGFSICWFEFSLYIVL